MQERCRRVGKRIYETEDQVRGVWTGRGESGLANTKQGASRTLELPASCSRVVECGMDLGIRSLYPGIPEQWTGDLNL